MDLERLQLASDVHIRRRMRVLVLSMICACFACPASETDVAPDELHTGVYELEISTRSDTCAPARFLGDAGLIPAFVNDEGIGYFEPVSFASGIAFYRVELVAQDGYALSTGAGIDIGSGCGGHVERLIERRLMATTTDGFVVNRTEDWTITLPCRPDVQSDVPQASCQVDQDLRYKLVTACDAPCQLRSDGPAPWSCVCPSS